jgi:arsenical pump membrane protein
VLTPIVYALVLRLSLDPIPFVFATTFIADTASIGLPVSNPLNVIVVDRFHIGLVPYVSHLWLAALLPIAANAAAFFLLYRRQLRGHFRVPAETPTASAGLASTAAGLFLVAVAYLVASALELPLGVVAVAGAVLLALNLWRVDMLRLGRLRREMSWPIFGFIAGMLLVVQALHDSDITEHIGALLLLAGRGSGVAAIVSSTIGAALGSNLINNLPMALVMTRTIPEIHASTAVHQSLIYGTIAGCDLGPNLTHLGSLATFIWLFFLRRKGLDVSAWDYLRVGALVTPLLLASAIAGVWLAGAL